MSVENPLENRNEETENQNPEQLAKELASAYWNNRKQEIRDSMASEDVDVYGGDFDTARAEAYLSKIEDGNFYETVKIEGTYDGDPKKTEEKSVYDFFKVIAGGTDGGQEAQRIVEAIEGAKGNKKQGRVFVGTRKNPDGSIDYSRAMELKMDKGQQNESKDIEQVEDAEFSKDVQAILKHLDGLDKLLDPKSFKADWPGLDRTLNMNITGITAFRRVLSEVSAQEADAMLQKAQQVENKMQQALDICEAERIKREKFYKDEKVDGKVMYISDETINWLKNEGPLVMKSLRDLHTLESGKIKNRRKKYGSRN